MKFFYSIVIRGYNLIVVIASAFNRKAAIMILGRKRALGDIKKVFEPGDRIFWFHCASLGEFEQGRPVIEKIKEKDNSIRILLSFYSPSGYEVRKNYGVADCVVYLPLDTRRNARRFIKELNPEKVIFIKYEFWYNYLAILQEENIPVYLISGIFRKGQPFFMWYGNYYRNILKDFTHLYVQDESSAALLKHHGFGNYTVSGDTRFDRVMDISRRSAGVAAVEQFSRGRNVIVAGSSWQPEEEMIARYISESARNTRWIIAPHNTDKSNIDRIAKLFSGICLRYTELAGKIPGNTKVLIIDTIGILSSIYRYAGIAIIGGGFGRGIHNILEAATWGIPVMFGPKYDKFKEAADLISLGGARSFSDYMIFRETLDNFMDQPSELEKAGRISRKYINTNLGATDLISAELLT